MASTGWSLADALKMAGSIFDGPSKSEIPVLDGTGPLFGQAEDLQQQIAFVESLGRKAMGMKEQSPGRLLTKLLKNRKTIIDCQMTMLWQLPNVSTFMNTVNSA